MRPVTLRINAASYDRLLIHLLPARARAEEAAFLLCTYATPESAFTCVETMVIAQRQFAVHSRYHLELGDAARASVIKAAHDRGCSLVEIHSHPFSDTAEFSASDSAGLADFVPHVWWRLKHRPYAALVVTPSSVDGLAWIESPDVAEPLVALEVNGRRLPTSGRSFSRRFEAYA